MDRFLQGILQRVGRGERGEVGEHDFFEADIVEHGLEDEGALLQLSGGEDDDADHRQPAIAEQACDHQDHGDGVADGNGAPRGGGRVESAGKECPQDASAIQWVSRHEIENRQIKIGPHQAARQVGGLEKRPPPKLNSAARGSYSGCCKARQDEAHERSDQSKANVALPHQGRLRLFNPRFVVERDTGERKQDHCLWGQADAASGDHVSALMSRYASQNDTDQRQVARSVGRALMGGVLRPEDEHGQDEERKVDADVHAKQTSYRYGPASHKPSLLLFYMDGYSDCGTQEYRGMRVIAGKYRSRPLRSLRGMDVRPTSDRLRETLFNVLTAGNPAALEGSIWLDLFAGTGAVGIEALSRGAKEVYFLEHSAPAADAIRGNLQSLGIVDGFKILQEELPRAFWRMERQHVAADVVFIDPPYRMQDAYTKTLRALADSSLVWAMSVVIAEHEKKFDPGEEFGHLRRFRHLAQGSAALSFYRMASGGDLRV